MTGTPSLEFLNERSPFNTINGIKIKELTRESCTVEAELSTDSLNPWGSAHGGLIYAMCDVAAGVVAAHGILGCVTQSGSIYYLRPSTGTKLRAVAKTVKRGRNIVFVETNVYDDHDRLTARGDFQIFMTNEVKAQPVT